jgi:hypothetical protein
VCEIKDLFGFEERVRVGWMRFQELGLWEVRFCRGVILFIGED